MKLFSIKIHSLFTVFFPSLIFKFSLSPYNYCLIPRPLPSSHVPLVSLRWTVVEVPFSLGGSICLSVVREP